TDDEYEQDLQDQQLAGDGEIHATSATDEGHGSDSGTTTANTTNTSVTGVTSRRKVVQCRHQVGPHEEESCEQPGSARSRPLPVPGRHRGGRPRHRLRPGGTARCHPDEAT